MAESIGLNLGRYSHHNEVSNHNHFYTCICYPEAVKSLYKVLLALAVIVVAIVGSASYLIHKTNSRTKQDFIIIDQTFSQLQLDQLGSIKIDVKSGAHQIVEGSLPTREVVVFASGQPDNMRQIVESRLMTSGFSLRDPNATCFLEQSCRFANTGEKLSALLLIYRPSEIIKDSLHPTITYTVPNDQAGIDITITNNSN